MFGGMSVLVPLEMRVMDMNADTHTARSGIWQRKWTHSLNLKHLTLTPT